MKSNPELYTAIAAFDIDGGPAKLSFAARLARENRWTLAFAERVVREYKRFAYLCRVAGHPCTPSDEVDQAWHLHMLYTESYWRRFCGEVLGSDLHHGPTKGGAAENAKFDDWYSRTMATYLAEFGEAPPSDIWPPSEVRFGLAPHFARVNTRTHWVIRKPNLRWVAGLVIGGLVLAGCEPDDGLVGFLCLAIGVAGAAFLVYVIQKGKNGGNGGGCSTTGCGGISGCAGDAGGESGCSSGCGGGGCGGGCGS